MALHSVVSQSSATGRSTEVVNASDIKFRYLNVRRKDPHITGERMLSHDEFARFEETTTTIAPAEAEREAERCINCGTCTACDRCLNFCPDFCITKNENGRYVIDYDVCKGCLLCADVCERGVILLRKEGDDVK
ncbi:MAG: 4Fe-4S binding protein [Parcubacteria group bacterium]|nr:4Fe-4S binding protein [Parcubacteria group bacterium]